MSLMIGFSILALWIGIFWLYRDYEVDRYRQRLFELRDELWDFAHAGNVRFDDRAYNLVRGRINGLIRFAHLLTITWIITALIAEKMRPSPQVMDRMESELASALQALPAPTAERLRDYQGRALGLAIEHVVLLSPFFWLAIAPVVLAAVISLSWRYCNRLVRRFPVRTLVDTEAARLGALA